MEKIYKKLIIILTYGSLLCDLLISHVSASISQELCSLANQQRRARGITNDFIHSNLMQYIADTHIDNLFNANHNVANLTCTLHSWYPNTTLNLPFCCQGQGNTQLANGLYGDKCIGSMGKQLTSNWPIPYTGNTNENSYAAIASGGFFGGEVSNIATPTDAIYSWVNSPAHLRTLLADYKICGGALKEIKQCMNEVDNCANYYVIAIGLLWLGDITYTASIPFPIPLPIPTTLYPPYDSSTIPPTKLPTNFPTKLPTNFPTKLPTNFPTKLPTNFPSNLPTKLPTNFPSYLPTNFPSNLPTKLPTYLPTNFPSYIPTKFPSNLPTKLPTYSPTNFPISLSTNLPTTSIYINDHTTAITRTTLMTSVNCDTNRYYIDSRFFIGIICIMVLCGAATGSLVMYLFMKSKIDKLKLQLQIQIPLQQDNVIRSKELIFNDNYKNNTNVYQSRSHKHFIDFVKDIDPDNKDIQRATTLREIRHIVREK